MRGKQAESKTEMPNKHLENWINQMLIALTFKETAKRFKHIVNKMIPSFQEGILQ